MNDNTKNINVPVKVNPVPVKTNVDKAKADLPAKDVDKSKSMSHLLERFQKKSDKKTA